MADEQMPKVLVMDDEPGVRRSMGRYLERWGYRCVEAGNVEQAAEILRTTEFCAFILDIRLPGGQSGLDLLEMLRRKTEFATIPILMMTGSVLTPEEELGINTRRAHIIYKPEGYDTIVQFLDQLTGRDRSH